MQAETEILDTEQELDIQDLCILMVEFNLMIHKFLLDKIIV